MPRVDSGRHIKFNGLMRASVTIAGQQQAVRVRNLNLLGAVLECDLPESGGPLQLQFEADGMRLEVPGEVLRRTEQGIFVAFGQLGLEALDELERLVHRLSGQEKANAPAAPAGEEAPGETMTIQPTWSPPVSEPMAQEWRPPGVLAHPPTGGVPQVRAWAQLPTRTAPPISPTAVRPAAKPPQPPPVERRTLPREERAIPLVFDSLTSLIKEFTHNISFGGLFVYTERSYRPGEEVAVTLIHPLSGERLTLLGRVAHVAAAPAADPLSGKERYGVGVQFRLPLEELRRILSDFIDSRQRPAPGIDRLLAEARRRLQEAEQGPRHLLGVDAEADELRIRQAYFDLVDRFHPDRYQGKVPAQDVAVLEELFRRLTAAYESLLG